MSYKRTLIETALLLSPDQVLGAWKVLDLPDNPAWVQDESGVYATVNITNDNQIRLDFVRARDDSYFLTVQSPYARALYKWIAANLPELGQEHNLYIGYEIGRAEQAILNKTEYVQS
jgi:hypothetical protein